MNKSYHLSLLLACGLIAACSEAEQQQAAEDMSYQKAREQAQQVQEVLEDQAAKQRKQIDEAEQ